MASFGEELRRERELRDISLDEVSEATKISVRFLEAIERNDFGSLPGGVYNRGIVRAYCHFIGADAEAMVNAYLLEEQTRVESGARPAAGLLRGGRSVAAPTNAVSRRSPKRRSMAPWILLALFVVILVACIVLYTRFTGGGAGGPGAGALAP